METSGYSLFSSPYILILGDTFWHAIACIMSIKCSPKQWGYAHLFGFSGPIPTQQAHVQAANQEKNKLVGVELM